MCVCSSLNCPTFVKNVLVAAASVASSSSFNRAMLFECFSLSHSLFACERGFTVEEESERERKRTK